MDNLLQLLKSVNSTLTESEMCEKFDMIAEIMLNEYLIVGESDKFQMLEIEFYYHCDKLQDRRLDNPKRTITYQRNCNAGDWLFHDSGVDLSFDSKEGTFGGGILIRKIRSLKEDEIIEGSQKCYWKIFPEKTDAFAPTSFNPHFEKIDKPLENKYHKCPRKGLEKKEETAKPWRYVVEL